MLTPHTRGHVHSAVLIARVQAVGTCHAHLAYCAPSLAHSVASPAAVTRMHCSPGTPVTVTWCLGGCAGQVLRLCMDPGGVLAISCHSDGCVRIYDMKSGALMWRAWGHAAHVAAAALSPDLTQLLSVGGDGCIVVWKLPEGLVQQLQAAACEVATAKEQAGYCVPSPPQLPARQRGSLCGDPAASPSPGGTAAAAGGLGTPQQAGSAGGTDAVTPGSCSSDGGFGRVLKRIKQGKPLVSADKLPRWARSPTAASSAPVAVAAAPGRQQSTSEGGAHLSPEQQRNRWLDRCKQPAGGNSSNTTSDPDTQVGYDPFVQSA